jgi:hypothetical protein
MCENNERDKAQKFALEFFEKTMNLPAMIQMQKCSQIMEPNKEDKEDKAFKEGHIYDEGFDLPEL